MEKKKVKLAISSYIRNIDGGAREVPEVSDTQLQGELGERDGCVFLSYREETESGAVYCDIKAAEDKVTVLRRGAIESTMVFERGREFKTLYKLPPYSFDMEIETLEIKQQREACSFKLTLRYKMKIGGQEKFCRMKIEAV